MREMQQRFSSPHRAQRTLGKEDRAHRPRR
jgi:hypothetical protein